jgi:hypothetical protein
MTAEMITDILPESSTLSIKDVLITIDDNDLVLKIQNPVVNDKIRGDFELSEVDLRFDVIGLMPQSNRNILSVEISDPKLQLNKFLSTEDSEDGGQKLPIEQINTYLNKHKKQLVKFSLSLNNTKFSFNINEDRMVEVVINSLTLAPNIQNDKIVLSLFGDVNIAGNSNVIDLTIDTSAIKHLEFSGAVNNISTLLFESLGYPIKELSGSNLEVDVNFKGKTTSLRSLEYSEFEISNFRGKLVRNYYFDQDISPQHLMAKGEIFNNGEKILINDIDLKVENSTLKGSASLKNKRLITNLELSSLNVDQLSKYWAKNLIPRTRSWVFESVLEGDIPSATVKLDLDFGDPNFPKNLKKTAYDINVDINNAAYLLDKNYPLIKQINANVNIDAKEVIVKAKSATANKVKLTEIKGVLDRLGYSDSTFRLSGKVDGKTKDVVDLAFLFSKQKNDLFRDAKGDIKADLSMKLRIFDDIKSVKDLNLEVSAQIEGFASDSLIKNYPIHDGSFKANYKDAVIGIDGKTSIKSLPNVGVVGWINIF